MGQPRKFNDTEKWCPRCRKWLLHSLFYKLKASKAHPSGLQSSCMDCNKAMDKTKWERKAWLKYRYGITVEDYNSMFQRQSGKCAIPSCQNPAKHIDHDHNSGRVRSLLCGICNQGIGLFKENPDIMREAADYVEEHRRNTDVIEHRNVARCG